MSKIKFVSGKSIHVSKIPPVLAKNQIITVSVFLSTLQLTALLLKSFHPYLYCNTLPDGIDRLAVYRHNIKKNSYVIIKTPKKKENKTW